MVQFRRFFARPLKDLATVELYAGLALIVGFGLLLSAQVPTRIAATGGITKPSIVTMQPLAVPGAPTVTPTCVSACTTTWTYKIIALLPDAVTTTEAGAAGSTAAQNATLSGSNFNTLTWTAVTSAASYDVYRTVSGGTPASLGKIGNVTAATIVDNGLAGDAATAPTVNATGGIVFATDNRADIGKSGANRPANIFLGTAVNSPGYLTTTNCSSSAAPAVCAAAAAGSVVIAAAATTVVVNTTAVTANSQVLVMYDSSLGTKLSVTCNTTQPTLYGVTARTAATSFTITATAPITNPACFSYLVVN